MLKVSNLFKKEKIVRRFRYYSSRSYVDKNSDVYLILNQNWEDFSKDMYPKERRMHVFDEKNIEGMGTENVRLLINELVRRHAPDGVYLEVGTYRGSSLLGASWCNPSTRCIGVDNFSQFNSGDENRKIFESNLKKFNNPPNIEFHEGDFREVLPLFFSKKPATKVSIYFYDGSHTYKDQSEGLEIILPHLEEKALILVDDIGYLQVEKANNDFLKRNRGSFKSVFKIRTKGNRSPGWWNGFEVIEKKGRAG